MWPLSIVQIQISVNSSPGFTAIAISFQIYLLVFDAPPQTLYKDIVQVSALAIHADLDPPLQQQAAEGFTGELASLVGVEDLRLSFAQGFFQGRDTEAHLQSIGEPPGQHVSAVPVHNGHEVKESPGHGQV